MRAPLPHNEQERLQALDRCQLLDTPPEETYDRITRVAAQIFSTPVAAVSLVARDRQFLKSVVGLETRQIERDIAFCAHTILQEEPVVVLDARLDPRFSANPLVTGEPGIRFYCGAPLKAPNGFPLGALCVIDTEPRTEVPEPLVRLLRELAAQAGTEIKHHQERLHWASTSTALWERERDLQREKQLRYDSEIRAELALAAGRMGSWEWDAVSRHAVLSPVARRLFGHAGTNSARRHFQWLAHVPPEDRKLVAQQMRTAYSEGSVFDLEFRVVPAGESARWVALKGCYRRDDHGKPAGANGVCWDITECKHLEEERHASQELTRRILDSSADCIKVLDLDGCLLSMSPGGQRALGIADLQPLLGREYLSLWENQEDRAAAQAAFQAAVAGGTGSFQGFFPRANGELRWWDTVFSPIADLTGKPERILAVSRDMTELRRVSVEQEKARKLAEEANRAKSLFLANVSHELRTPLNGVLGMTELLLESQLNRGQQELAETVKQSGAALLALVNDLLDLSRVEAGKLDCQSAAFDLRSAINQAAALISPLAQQKHLELTVDYPDSLPSLLVGDENRIRQIVINYLNNALTFTDKGKVSVEVRAEPLEGATANFLITVCDTGKGIPPEAQADLFTPFRQTDSSSTRKHGGLGLGLAISKRIAEAMGGSVGLMSKPGTGSAFWVKLPLTLAEKGAGKPFQDPCAVPGVAAPAPPRVLVAEDNAINQKVVLRFLAKLGCVPDVAPNGAAAVRLFEQNTYDLVLMDCQMPELDGYQATGQIRERESRLARKRTPIIAVTAHAMVGDRERCLQSGMDDYLAKPLSLESLKKALAKWRVTPGARQV